MENKPILGREISLETNFHIQGQRTTDKIGVRDKHGQSRPSHLQIPDGPKMARVALSRRAIDGSRASKLMKRPSGATPACCLAPRWPLMDRTDPRLTGHLDWLKMARLK